MDHTPGAFLIRRKNSSSGSRIQTRGFILIERAHNPVIQFQENRTHFILLCLSLRIALCLRFAGSAQNVPPPALYLGMRNEHYAESPARGKSLYWVLYGLASPPTFTRFPSSPLIIRVPKKKNGKRVLLENLVQLSPQAQNGPKTLYNMVFRPKSLQIWVLRALGFMSF